MSGDSLLSLLARASRLRESLMDERHESAFRLFSGFAEGCPDLVIEIFATTAVIYNYAEIQAKGRPLVEEAQAFLQDRFPWILTGVEKIRKSSKAGERRGKLLFGSVLDRKIRENNVWYAIDLMIHQDTSFYLDTRNLRGWAIRHLRGKTVLNTFAYTGSLGVAALMGGARQVIQLDRNPHFLEVAKSSYALNSLPIQAADFLAGDFWTEIGHLKRSGVRFDCIFIDPPFFASSSQGVVDQVHHSARLINKVRPLVEDGGYLIAMNNALFVNGSDFYDTLQSLCRDGYMKILELIPVPEDSTGFPETRVDLPMVDPAPFNHATKMAILEVRRKSA